MYASGWIQLALYVVLLAAVTRPLGAFLYRVLERGRTFLDPVAGPVERLCYRAIFVDPETEQSWQQYAIAMLMFSVVSMLFTYAIMRLQYYLPLNPQKFTGTTEHLAFNTSASFTTNTNWQSYGGESTLSYFAQMVGLVFHNFASAAVGIAIAAALVRGLARDKMTTVGNFWVDLVRLTLYVLLPVCVVYAVFLVSQGMIQNFKPYTAATTMESVATNQPLTQTIAQGPVASQVSIKMLGTNGGGFFNANAAHPFENPTPLSNFVQILSVFALGSALTYYLGRMVKSQRHGWSVWAAMMILFVASTLVCWHYEAAGNPRMIALGVDPSMGNMEGKEVRFGTFNSALFATITTDASCGAVNSMHDSFTPIAGLVPLFNMHLGEVIVGGVGAGLYGMMVFIVLAIFIAGLMVGRTPEYLGKKIESYDVKVAVLATIAPSLAILFLSAWATTSDWGKGALNNAGPHGFSEIHYAYTSGAANNGSAFAGIAANEPHYDTTLGIDMLIGRFFIIIPVLALAGNLARKKLIPQSAGSFPVSGGTFVVLLIGTVVIVGALTFLPALSLGPVVEHFVMRGTNVTY